MSPTPTKRRIVLIPDGWERARRDFKIFDDAELASRLGVSYTTIWRVYNGRQQPGPDFIAAALDCFRSFRFEELFKVQRLP